MKKKVTPLYGPSDHGRPHVGPVPELRGRIAATAEEVDCPSRFDFDLSEAPMVKITDLATGRRAECALFAYRSVREVLAALHPEV
jgi:hypothetical protein